LRIKGKVSTNIKVNHFVGNIVQTNFESIVTSCYHVDAINADANTSICTATAETSLL